ncbi:hypothetical protein [Gloeothece verrucosa]|uniref:Uncharacterized protein n=1 Tax=Gloeothece verrucosa (strain PCC 7822) TaxID=497965 RepID=E0UCG2_GLOV7|nr:hypothetical protein [Gloeothece verrucosa]ADN14033.1 hypothetical protein Cyan7822_2051 [Gloeothece verrucosa PCC 7822]
MTLAIFFINLAQIGMISTALSLVALHLLKVNLWNYDDNEVVKIFEIVRVMGLFLIILSIILFFTIAFIST